MDVSDDESGLKLTQLVGEVALADSELDHWLNLLLQELTGMSGELVSILTPNDTSERRAEKLIKIVHLADHDPTIIETLKAVRPLKRRRDEAVHSFYYAGEDSDRLRRYRTRGETSSTSLVELAGLRDEIRHLGSRLEEAVLSASIGRAKQGDLQKTFEDCFEVLSMLRMKDTPEAADLIARSSSQSCLVLKLWGQGSWRCVDESEPFNFDGLSGSDAVVAFAKIWPANGEVWLYLPDGRVMKGGDTGWRDVLDIVKAVTPSARRRVWRRVNGVEQYVADEQAWWPPAGLAERLTSASARDLVEQWQRERSTFLGHNLPGGDS